MKAYRVDIPLVGFVSLTVKADDPESAINRAFEIAPGDINDFDYCEGDLRRQLSVGNILCAPRHSAEATEVSDDVPETGAGVEEVVQPPRVRPTPVQPDWLRRIRPGDEVVYFAAGGWFVLTVDYLTPTRIVASQAGIRYQFSQVTGAGYGCPGWLERSTKRQVKKIRRAALIRAAKEERNG